MKRILIILLLAPSLSFAQSIDKIEIDKFTGAKRLQTDWLNIKTMGPIWLLKVKIRTVDSTVFFQLSGKGRGVVGTDDATIFLFDDTSSFKIYPTSIQSYNIGFGNSPDTYDFQYYFSSEKLKILASKKIISVRRTFNENYEDIDIKDKFATRLKNLAEMVVKKL